MPIRIHIHTQDADQWITVNGAHALIGPNGKVKAGMGGKFKGKKVGGSSTEKRKKKTAKSKEKTAKAKAKAKKGKATGKSSGVGIESLSNALNKLADYVEKSSGSPA